MQSLFGFDLPTAQKWVIAFGVILVLLVLLGLFARQIKDGRLRIKGQGGGRTRQPRLGVVDIHDLDRQRQLVLIRRDNVEHLIMIGGASDVVVETNIMRSGARAAVPAQAEIGVPERPLPFDTLMPQEPLRPEPAEDPRRAPPPAPVALAPSGVEPPLPPVRSAVRPTQTLTQAEAAVAAAAAGGIAAIGGAALSRAQSTPAAAPPAPASAMPAPNFTREHAPAPAVSAGELDDMARQLDEALKRPFSAVRPSGAPANITADPGLAVAPPEPAPPPVEPQPQPAPPVIVPPAPVVTATRVVPLDVEAELEMALGLKPERITPKPPIFAAPVFPPSTAPKPFEPAPPPKPEPVVVSEPVAVEPLPEPEPEPEIEVVPEPATEPQMGEDESEAIPTEQQADEAEASEAEEEPAPAPEERKPAPPEPEPEPEPKAIDPFSVDAIEAEFARLLGRDPKPRA